MESIYDLFSRVLDESGIDFSSCGDLSCLLIAGSLYSLRGRVADGVISGLSGKDLSQHPLDPDLVDQHDYQQDRKYYPYTNDDKK